MNYSPSNLCQFITDAFSDEEFKQLCFDNFPECESEFSDGMPKGEKIRRLVGWCKRRDRISDLFQALELARPKQFERHFSWVTTLPVKILDLSPRCRKLAIETPKAWEDRLFAQAWVDFLEKERDKRRDWQFAIKTDSPIYLRDPKETIDWLQFKFTEVTGMVSSYKLLIEKVYQEARGPSGLPGDAGYLVYVAQRMADLYRRIIEWSIDLKTAIVDDAFSGVMLTASKMTDDLIPEIEETAKRFNFRLEEAVAELERKPEGTRVTIEETLRFRIPQPALDEFEQELTRLAEAFRVKPRNFNL